jgi:hypothetical protein
MTRPILEADFKRFSFSMTKKCKAGEEKTHWAQELRDGLHGRLDVGEIGLGVGSGNGLGGCWAVGSLWAVGSRWAVGLGTGRILAVFAAAPHPAGFATSNPSPEHNQQYPQGFGCCGAGKIASGCAGCTGCAGWVVFLHFRLVSSPSFSCLLICKFFSSYTTTTQHQNL